MNLSISCYYIYEVLCTSKQIAKASTYCETDYYKRWQLRVLPFEDSDVTPVILSSFWPNFIVPRVRRNYTILQLSVKIITLPLDSANSNSYWAYGTDTL